MSTPPNPPNPSNVLQYLPIAAEDFANPDQFLSLLGANFQNLFQQIRMLSGQAGTIKLSDHLDLNGKRIMNVGSAETETDVVTLSYATLNYGPAALTPQIQALGKYVMANYRRLGDQNQREPSSSFLVKILNTAPTSNTSFITAGSPSGGNVAVTISSGTHDRVDGSSIPYSSRTDTLALPTQYAITHLQRTSGIVTAVTAVTPLGVGDGFSVINSSDSSFDGTFSVLTGGGGSFTYAQGGPDTGAVTGGSISIGGVYYYTIDYGNDKLGLAGPFSSDTWGNRRVSSPDGTTIIGVVVLNGNGLDTTASAAGGTPPQSGTPVVVIRRL